MEMPSKPQGISSRHFIHGLSHTPLDNVYKSMISRCYKTNNNRYHRYGGRGIKVCDEWKNDKKIFFEWAINNGYEEGLTLDRRDGNKNYSPENCRWVTQQIQQNNRCNNRRIIIDGIEHTAAEWARIIEVNPANIYSHVKRNNAEDYIRNKLCTR